jgi:tetratricopeptide (TPR) repeat protein
MDRCPPREQLEYLLAERLDDAERERVEAHVEACAACQGVLDELAGPPPGAAGQLRTAAANGPGHGSANEFLRRLEKGRPAETADLVRTGGEEKPSLLAADPAPPWADNRPQVPGYEIEGELGRGGMGVVYKAYDRRRRETVALKVMRQFDAPSLYRFKQEFRALADLSHANLVTLYDLVGEGGWWFFTMEFIDGVDFLSHVRGGNGAPASQPTAPCPPPLATSAEAGPAVPAPPRPSLPAAQLARLRPALRQLAEGVSALHAAGKLHRDIKPMNVRVTAAGRVVLLDFGLVVELGGPAEREIAGTAAYMAPEQAAGLPPTPAGDWYSVGVMLHEALTGRLPFVGPAPQVLRDKQQAEPPPPRTRADGVPADLDALCADLLRRDPAARPPDADVLRRLGVSSAAGHDAPRRPAGSGRAPLVGRALHLAALADTFAAVRQGRTVVLHVHGRPGVGKSALVKHFLDGLAERGEALVLAGRCYEQEAVPYKALDGLVDALSRYLNGLAPLEVQALLPREVHLLTHAFPVLQRVRGVAAAPRRRVEMVNPHEARRRAFAALGELLARLGDRRPLVLFIDDLQWGDVDSADQLVKLLRPPDPPLLLLLACYRSEDAATSPCLRLLLQAKESEPDRRRLSVDPLTEAEARDLALALLGPGDSAAQAHAEAIARESGGNPYFIQVLAQRLAEQADHPARAGEFTLDQVLWARIQALPEQARGLLEVVAVSGQPLPQADACRAADLGPEVQRTLAVLRSGRLIRNSGPAWEEVETYHDRIRESILAHLPAAALKDHHGRLARALEASEEGQDSKKIFNLAYHFDAAGDSGRALPYALAAAERARSQHALRIAEQLYRIAERGAAAADEATRYRVAEGLGEVLTLAGRFEEAARQLHAAQALAPGELGRAHLDAKLGDLAFQRGDLQSAVETLRSALGRLARRVPRRQATFYVLVLWEILVQVLHTYLPSLFLGRRGLAGAEAELSAVRFYSRLSYVYWFQGGKIPCLWAHLRQLNLAERYPSTPELAQAYSQHGPIMGMIGNYPRGIAYAEQSLAIRQDLGDVWGQGQSLHFLGVVLYAASRFEECIERCREAEMLLEETGDQWEVNSVRYHGAASRFRLGDLRGAVAEARRYHQGALALGTTTTTGWAVGLWALVSGGKVPPEILQAELQRPSDDAQRMAHLLLAEAMRGLAEGRPLAAAESLDRAQRLVEKAGLRNHLVSPLLPWLATALRQAAEEPGRAGGERKALRRRAEAAARRGLRLARRFPNDLPHALRESALLAAHRGRARRARKLLDESLAVAERQGARYEHARTLLARGETGRRFGWPEAAADLAAARPALQAIEESR